MCRFNHQGSCDARWLYIFLLAHYPRHPAATFTTILTLAPPPIPTAFSPLCTAGSRAGRGAAAAKARGAAAAQGRQEADVEPKGKPHHVLLRIHQPRHALWAVVQGPATRMQARMPRSRPLRQPR